MTDVPVFP